VLLCRMQAAVDSTGSDAKRVLAVGHLTSGAPTVAAASASSDALGVGAAKDPGAAAAVSSKEVEELRAALEASTASQSALRWERADLARQVDALQDSLDTTQQQLLQRCIAAEALVQGYEHAASSLPPPVSPDAIFREHATTAGDPAAAAHAVAAAAAAAAAAVRESQQGAPTSTSKTTPTEMRQRIRALLDTLSATQARLADASAAAAAARQDASRSESLVAELRVDLAKALEAHADASKRHEHAQSEAAQRADALAALHRKLSDAEAAAGADRATAAASRRAVMARVLKALVGGDLRRAWTKWQRVCVSERATTKLGAITGRSREAEGEGEFA
jgi:chromosome segregation ATPase